MPSNETVQGLQSLLESMESLPLVLQKNLIARALRKAGQLIADAIKRLAPFDPKTIGNRIPDSVTVAVRDQTATGARAVIGPGKKGFMAIFHEGGTPKMAARPFIAPAFDQNVDKAYEELEEILGDGIEREFEKRGM